MRLLASVCWQPFVCPFSHVPFVMVNIYCGYARSIAKEGHNRFKRLDFRCNSSCTAQGQVQCHHALPSLRNSRHLCNRQFSIDVFLNHFCIHVIIYALMTSFFLQWLSQLPLHTQHQSKRAQLVYDDALPPIFSGEHRVNTKTYTTHNTHNLLLRWVVVHSLRTSTSLRFAAMFYCVNFSQEFSRKNVYTTTISLCKRCIPRFFALSVTVVNHSVWQGLV
jgi:hypothetical protein